ncbi:hypothetical protein Thivi_3297 [Thiocystis violascens DSM 198]|uniref:Uncharacterized protein n=1 Tax=Thiocystis violascens (strain ATCC 17096 / DSM 198 / 6111) TaxID=765911 RepID=I3YDV2_THIV6|nr:hypothetical protein Thivi_3297 [Thiocystis violascens DSM 198]
MVCLVNTRNMTAELITRFRNVMAQRTLTIGMELSLLERSEGGGMRCPFEGIHVESDGLTAHGTLSGVRAI